MPLKVRLRRFLNFSKFTTPTAIPEAELYFPLLQPDNTMATAVDQKLLRQTKFPPEFNQKVDMKKVNIEVMKT
jgi:hypothetical protein